MKLNLMLFAVIAIMFLISVIQSKDAKNLTLQRDQEKAARVMAEETTEAIRRESILITESFEKVRKEDHARFKFTKENAVAVERGRESGDGPLAPVLRDAAERVRNRYQDRLQKNGNPG